MTDIAQSLKLNERLTLLNEATEELMEWIKRDLDELRNGGFHGRIAAKISLHNDRRVLSDRQRDIVALVKEFAAELSSEALDLLFITYSMLVASAEKLDDILA